MQTWPGGIPQVRCQCLGRRGDRTAAVHQSTLVPCRPKKNGDHPKSQQCLVESSSKFDSSRQHVFYWSQETSKLKPQTEVLRCLTAAFKRPCHKIHKTQEAFSKDLPILEHDCKCEALHVFFIGTLTSMCQNSTRTFRRGLDCKGSEHLRHLPGAIHGKLMSHNPLQARLFCSFVKILQIYLKASHFTPAKHVQGNTSTPFSHWRFAFTTSLPQGLGVQEPCIRE